LIHELEILFYIIIWEKLVFSFLLYYLDSLTEVNFDKDKNIWKYAYIILLSVININLLLRQYLLTPSDFILIIFEIKIFIFRDQSV